MNREDTQRESTTMNQFNPVASIMPIENLSIHPNSNNQPWISAPLQNSHHHDMNFFFNNYDLMNQQDILNNNHSPSMSVQEAEQFRKYSMMTNKEDQLKQEQENDIIGELNFSSYYQSRQTINSAPYSFDYVMATSMSSPVNVKKRYLQNEPACSMPSVVSSVSEPIPSTSWHTLSRKRTKSTRDSKPEPIVNNNYIVPTHSYHHQINNNSIISTHESMMMSPQDTGTTTMMTTNGMLMSSNDTNSLMMNENNTHGILTSTSSSNASLVMSPSNPSMMMSPSNNTNSMIMTSNDNNASMMNNMIVHSSNNSYMDEQVMDYPQADSVPFDQSLYRNSTDSNQMLAAMPRRQKLRYEGDNYTPKWVRFTGHLKEGYCDSCQPGKWLQLKNSAYWYHKQFYHGISSVSGKSFMKPLEQRMGKGDVIEGLCHQCGRFVSACNGKKKNNYMLWYRHAHKCHLYDKPKATSKSVRKLSNESIQTSTSISTSASYPLQNDTL